VAAPLLILAICQPLVAFSETSGSGPWVVRVFGWSEEQLPDLGERFDHIGVYREKEMVLLQADTADDWAWLLDQGLEVRIDRRRTDVLREIERYRLQGRAVNAIPGFECYRSVEEMLDTGVAIAAEYPDLATWTDIGDSWEKINLPPAGYDIRVLTLTNSAVGGDKPALLVFGSTHAREYVTAEFVTRFAEHLVALHGVDPDVTWILDHHEVHLVLVLNPDGRKRAETGILWRKNADNDFCTDTNLRGIDLNRNFDFMWGNSVCNGSSSSECSTTFHGPFAASEPEAMAGQAQMTAIFPDQRPDDQTTPAPLDAEGIFLDVHAFGEIVLTSWGCIGTTGPPPNNQGLLTLARKIAYFPGYDALVGSTGAVDGSTKDFSYGRLGVPGFTVEMGTAFFEECSYFEEAILEPNLEGFTHVGKNVRTPYMTPAGPDTVDLAVAPLPIAVGSSVGVTATIDDTRYNTGAEPSHVIQGAEIYVDTPPWAGGSPLAMTAVDGNFDQTVEAVEGTVATGALSTGRHTVFVRGRDVGGPEAGGTHGAMTAAFLYLIDPATSPTLQGVVTDRDGGDPLDATVAIGPFEIQTGAGTGAYDLQLPVGTYDVTVSAPGYAPQTVQAVDLEASEVETLDFELDALVTLFSDDVEAGNQGWTAELPWAITEETSNSPTHSWTDSPGGNYGNDADTSLTSPIFDLGFLEGVLLTFRHIYDFEPSFDRGLVEVSTDGVVWSAVKTFSQQDQTAQWELVQVPLPALDGAPQARVRFRIESDGGLTRDGWHIDDIVLEAASPVVIFADGFESGDTSAWSNAVP
jgi:hypothetical protein